MEKLRGSAYNAPAMNESARIERQKEVAWILHGNERVRDKHRAVRATDAAISLLGSAQPMERKEIFTAIADFYSETNRSRAFYIIAGIVLKESKVQFDMINAFSDRVASDQKFSTKFSRDFESRTKGGASMEDLMYTVDRLRWEPRSSVPIGVGMLRREHPAAVNETNYNGDCIEWYLGRNTERL